MKKEESKKTLNPEEIKQSVKQEREWLKQNDAVSAVNDGPVEDLEGMPLVSDDHQGMPPAHSDAKSE